MSYGCDGSQWVRGLKRRLFSLLPSPRAPTPGAPNQQPPDAASHDTLMYPDLNAGGLEIPPGEQLDD